MPNTKLLSPEQLKQIVEAKSLKVPSCIGKLLPMPHLVPFFDRDLGLPVTGVFWDGCGLVPQPQPTREGRRTRELDFDGYVVLVLATGTLIGISGRGDDYSSGVTLEQVDVVAIEVNGQHLEL